MIKTIGRQGIMFFSGGWTVGGIERVTVVLANELAQRGRSVVVAYFVSGDERLLGLLDPRVKVVKLPAGWRYGRRVYSAIRRALVENDVGFVLNAFRLNFVFRLACRSVGAKQISCIHSQPDMNGRVLAARSPLLRFFWRRVTAINRLVAYLCSDATVVLCEGYKEVFGKLVGACELQRLHAIPNPLTMPPAQCSVAKKNVLLYVGRLAENPKRVSRVIEAWRILSDRLPDWSLEILGDGPDREMYESCARGMDRIHFRGATDPVPYYERARLLALVSDYEGWPLVLNESMSRGCVPIVYASYRSAGDIVSSGRDGVCLPVPFDLNKFCDEVVRLACDRVYFDKLSDEATRSSVRYSVEKIADRWESLMEGLR